MHPSSRMMTANSMGHQWMQMQRHRWRERGEPAEWVHRPSPPVTTSSDSWRSCASSGKSTPWRWRVAMWPGATVPATSSGRTPPRRRPPPHRQPCRRHCRPAEVQAALDAMPPETGLETPALAAAVLSKWRRRLESEASGSSSSTMCAFPTRRTSRTERENQLLDCT